MIEMQNKIGQAMGILMMLVGIGLVVIAVFRIVELLQ